METEDRPSGSSFQRMMEPVIPWVIVGLLSFVGGVTWYTSMQVATLTERVDNLKNDRDVQILALEKRIERLEK